MRLFAFTLVLLGLLSLSAQCKDTPYVILVSFDGFRHDYVERFNLTHFKEFIRQGAAAEGLIPSFPSKTFPNHYTIVTGLYPGHHGLVDNSFFDSELDLQYGMRDRDRVENATFYGGTPLWQLVQQKGLHSASYFWVGSEAPIQGRYPTYYYKYDESVADSIRVDQAITWLTLPKKERPHFITLYFSLVDSEGHRTGTHSEQLKSKLQEADNLLGRLMHQVKRINLPVNIILVSDHGMLELKQEEASYITLSHLINFADSSVKIINGGTQVHLYSSLVDSLHRILKKNEIHYRVYKRDEMPLRWHYNNPRVGDLLLVAHPGYYFQILSKNFGNVKYPVFGVHGYDPAEVPEMNGIFYASGPNIKTGATLPAFENVHIYPFIARLLGIQPPVTDGDLSVLNPIYQK